MIAGWFFCPLRRASATTVAKRDGRLTSSDMVMDCAKIGLVVKQERRKSERVCAADKTVESAESMWRGEIERWEEKSKWWTEGEEKVRYLNFFSPV